MNPGDWITQAEAARLRKVSHQAIRSLVALKRLRTTRFGGNVFVSREDVINFVALPAGRKPRRTLGRKRGSGT